MEWAIAGSPTSKNGRPPALPGRQEQFDSAGSLERKLPLVSRQSFIEREFLYVTDRRHQPDPGDGADPGLQPRSLPGDSTLRSADASTKDRPRLLSDDRGLLDPGAHRALDPERSDAQHRQLFAYVILTSAELLVSITCLEFSYTQAPKALKSLVMAFFLMSISIGNLFTATVNFFIQNPDGSSKLEGPDYYLFFAGAMAVTAIVFIPVSMRYREKTHIQGEEVELAAEEPAPAI